MNDAPDLLHAPATKKAMARLLPVLGIAYFMSYIDRTNIALAKTALAADVGISVAAYGLGAGLFFLSYAFLEVPSNLIMYRVGARLWITRIAITWGAISAAMMFVSNEWSFYLLRVLLGAAEAGLFPAMMYMVTLWFAQQHRVKVVGFIYFAPAVAMIIGNPLGGALMELHGVGGLRGWQWMFLIEGLITIVAGVLVWFLLPGKPSEAKWLTPAEADVLTERATAGGAAAPERIRGNLGKAFSNPAIVVLALIYFINQTIGGGVGFNFPAFLKSLGLESSFAIGLVAGGGGFGALAGILLFPWLKNRYGREVPMIGLCAFGGLLTLIGFIASRDPVWSVALIYISTFFQIGTLPLFWSIAMSRLSGLLAAAGLAFINMVGIAGGFAGPYVYGLIESATGSLITPYYVLAGASCVGVALVGVLAVIIRRERPAEAPLAEAVP
ncbi:MFS transporter [Kribbella sp. NPDC051587]|uniref:MFS transporter n=1 Tax=Kribbella sp. NPDC051587 TaxID=3364119 RepID=UPI003791DB46